MLVLKRCKKLKSLFIAAMVLSFSAPFVFFSGSVHAQSCMEDVTEALDGSNAVPLNCTSNDVVQAAYTVVSGPTSCIAGETITVQMEANLLSNAAERYDIGLFIALDGGNALRGACHQDYLPDDAGTDAFLDLEVSEDPDDTCGDIEQGTPVVREIVSLDIVCEDTTGDGVADVGSCVSWDNAKSAGTNNKPSCTSQNDTRPNTKAKCRCEAVAVGTIGVQPQIIVKKETVPDGDPTEFDFTLSGPGPDVIFMLADGETYESGDLTPGTYSIVEAAEAGWSLAGVECISSQDGLLASETNIELNIGELVTCTFNNEQDTLISLASFTASSTGDGASVSWITAAEIDNAGFNVYRSRSASGPWTKVNDALIPAEGSPSSTTSYSLIDESGANFYMLEDVNTKGTTTRHNPVSANGSVSGTNSMLPTIFIPYF